MITYANENVFDRDVFRSIIESTITEDRIYWLCCGDGYEDTYYRLWKYDDDFYVFDKRQGVVVTWYKHLGRANQCFPMLTKDELLNLFQELKKEMDEVTEDVL